MRLLVSACALSLLLPVLARAEEVRPLAQEAHAPAVDLSRIPASSEGLRAPVLGGGHAVLTPDRELQQAAARLLGQARPHSGAIVAIDARTGRLLAFAELRAPNAQSLLLNSVAPAASVLKVVTSAALLERSRVTPDKRVCISGGLRSVERRHLDPPRSAGVSCGPFASALGHSRNAVYAQLVTRYLMRQDLIDVASRFGFNGDVPFDAPAPMGTLEVPYNDLEFARAATGFRGSTLSALGAAHMAFIVANGGRAAQLHIVQSAQDYAAPEHKQLLGKVIEPETARQLTRMMEVTVHSGTSLDAFTDESGKSFLPGIRIAGKTGTLKPASTPDTTSWFIGFAPSRSPEIVLSVLLENGPVWRRKARGLARDVLRAYFAARGRKNVTPPLAEELTPRAVAAEHDTSD